MKIAHIAAAWLCGLSALCLPTLCLAAVPLEHFAKLAAYEQIAISPSGEHVAIKTPMEDRSGVAIVRLDDMKMTGALKLSQGFHVYDLHWAGPERVLIELAQTFGALDAPRPTGELYTINADGGDKKYLFGFRGAKATGSHIKKVTQEYASAHLVDPLLDQPDHALVAINVWANGPNGYTSVERIDLRSGKRVPVTTAPAPGYSAFATDRDGAVRYAIAPTENLTGLQSFRLSAKGDEWQPLSRGERAGATIAPLGVWSNRALLASNEAGDRLCLVEHDLARDKRKTVVCDPTVDLTRVILSFDRRDAIAAIFDDGRPSYRFLNSGHPNEKELRDLLKAFGGEFVEPVSASADGQLSIKDRLYAVRTRIELHKALHDVDADEVPDTLKADAREIVAWAQQSASTPAERQAMANYARYTLESAGLNRDAEQLLLAEIERSENPYYFMPALADYAQARGEIDQALAWLERAYRESTGPATRAQWGYGYLMGLLEMVPERTEQVEAVALEIVGELRQHPSAYYQRTRMRFERLDAALQAWAKQQEAAASLGKISKAMQAVCVQLPDTSETRNSCDALFAANT